MQDGEETIQDGPRVGNYHFDFFIVIFFLVVTPHISFFFTGSDLLSEVFTFP